VSGNSGAVFAEDESGIGDAFEQRGALMTMKVGHVYGAEVH
jgi:hypothetical protein